MNLLLRTRAKKTEVQMKVFSRVLILFIFLAGINANSEGKCEALITRELGFHRQGTFSQPLSKKIRSESSVVFRQESKVIADKEIAELKVKQDAAEKLKLENENLMKKIEEKYNGHFMKKQELDLKYKIVKKIDENMARVEKLHSEKKRIQSVKKLADSKLYNRYQMNPSKENLLKNSVDYDKITTMGKSKDILEVYSKGGEIQAYTARYDDRSELVKFDEDCNVKEIILFGQSGEKDMYLSSQFCKDLPNIRNLISEIPSNEYNQFGARCREQGGEPSGADKESGACECRNLKGKYINPWSETCLVKRVIPSETAMDKFEKFGLKRAAKLDPFNKENAGIAAVICDKYKNYFVSGQGSVGEIDSSRNSSGVK